MMLHTNILVLGGAGFVGANVCLFVAKHYGRIAVTAFDNLSRAGSHHNLNDLYAAGVTFIHGDIRNESDMDRLSKHGFDLIIDCCAEPSVTAGYTQPQMVCDVNLGGTVKALEVARRVNADVIFLSTSRVYPIEPLCNIRKVHYMKRYDIDPTQIVDGVSVHGISESFTTTGHRTLYGTTKLASEFLIAEYANAFGLKAIINRCGVIAGPRQLATPNQGIFAYWMLAHRHGVPLKYIGHGGTGKQVRDVLHVTDLCELIVRQSEALSTHAGKTYNVGGGPHNTLSLAETTEMCQRISGATVTINPDVRNKPGDIPIYISDISRVAADFNWVPKRSPTNVLQDIYEWSAGFDWDWK